MDSLSFSKSVRIHFFNHVLLFDPHELDLLLHGLLLALLFDFSVILELCHFFECNAQRIMFELFELLKLQVQSHSLVLGLVSIFVALNELMLEFVDDLVDLVHLLLSLLLLKVVAIRFLLHLLDG